jgi:hypothetical protein
MRFVLALTAIVALSAPAFAAEWGYYANERFGYEIDIPPGFEGQGQSQNGDGQEFLLDGRGGELTVWGANFVIEPDFESEANGQFAADAEKGWGLLAQAATPTWATWSVEKSGRVAQQHMIQLCDGSSYAAFRLEYAQVDRPKIDGFVQDLITSFKPVC